MEIPKIKNKAVWTSKPGEFGLRLEISSDQNTDSARKAVADILEALSERAREMG